MQCIVNLDSSLILQDILRVEHFRLPAICVAQEPSFESLLRIKIHFFVTLAQISQNDPVNQELIPLEKMVKKGTCTHSTR